MVGGRNRCDPNPEILTVLPQSLLLPGGRPADPAAAMADDAAPMERLPRRRGARGGTAYLHLCCKFLRSPLFKLHWLPWSPIVYWSLSVARPCPGRAHQPAGSAPVFHIQNVEQLFEPRPVGIPNMFNNSSTVSSDRYMCER